MRRIVIRSNRAGRRARRGCTAPRHGRSTRCARPSKMHSTPSQRRTFEAGLHIADIPYTDMKTALGGSGTSLTAALTYSNVVFAGALLVWIFNALANVIRGTGNMLIPAIVTCIGAAVLIPL